MYKGASKTRDTLDASDLIKTPVPVNYCLADLVGVIFLKVMLSLAQIDILQITQKSCSDIMRN